LQRSPQRRRREAALKRLTPDPGRQIRVELAGLEQEPGSKPANIPVGDVRPVV
jgi:hypothetical protein